MVGRWATAGGSELVGVAALKERAGKRDDIALAGDGDFAGDLRVERGALGRGQRSQAGGGLIGGAEAGSETGFFGRPQAGHEHTEGEGQPAEASEKRSHGSLDAGTRRGFRLLLRGGETAGPDIVGGILVVDADGRAESGLVG